MRRAADKADRPWAVPMRAVRAPGSSSAVPVRVVRAPGSSSAVPVRAARVPDSSWAVPVQAVQVLPVLPLSERLPVQVLLCLLLPQVLPALLLQVSLPRALPALLLRVPLLQVLLPLRALPQRVLPLLPQPVHQPVQMRVPRAQDLQREPELPASQPAYRKKDRTWKYC